MLYSLLIYVFVISASILNLLIINDWQPDLSTKIIKTCDYIMIVGAVILIILILIEYF